MKPSRVFSSLFFILGTVLLIVSIVGCLLCRNMETKGQSVPQAAEAAAEEFAAAVSAGDLRAASSLIYGQPELGAEASFESGAAQMVWESFLDSLSCEGGAFRWEGTALYQDVTLSCLDVPGVMREVLTIAGAGRAEEETREDDQLLLEAVETAAAQGQRISAQGSLRLIEDGGSWYVIPDKTVLSALSGGLK